MSLTEPNQSGSSTDIGNPNSNCKNQPDRSNKSDQPTPSVPLTTKAVTIREDMTKPNGESVNWDESWKILKDSLTGSQLVPVIESPSGEEIDIHPSPQAYSEPWMEKSYAKILDGDRGIRKRFDDPSTAFITLTASGYRNGQFSAPIDQYLDLDRSWSIDANELPDRKSRKRPIYEKLRKLKQKYDLETAYVIIDGVHNGEKSTQSGSDNRLYTHRHILVYVDGAITDRVLEDVFYSIRDEHLKYCPSATANQHPYSETIKVDNNPEAGLKPIGDSDRERGLVTPFARDIASHLPDVHDGGRPDRLFAGMMRAINKKSWRDNAMFRSAYRDEFEEREGVVHPDRWESDGDGSLKGWRLPDDSLVPCNDSDDKDDSEGFLTTSKPIPDYYAT